MIIFTYNLIYKNMEDKKNCCSVIISGENCKKEGRFDAKTGKIYFLKGYCELHYQKFKTYGDPLFEKSRRGENRAKNSLYATLAGIKQRCYNKNNPAYCNYGGRGITVCDRWLGINGFSNFKKDMGEKPSKEYSIDRLNNDLGYSNENCKWSNRTEQARNRRKRKDGNNVVGVHYNNKGNVYEIYFVVNRKQTYFGRYKTEEDAVKRVEELKIDGIGSFNN
jgi:hypothetical protein